MAFMWNKIYLILLAVAVLGIAVLTYISADWLNSVGDPKIAVENYNYFSNISWSFLLISSLVLLLVGNALLFKTRKAWALWATFVYFSVFIILHSFWLGEKYVQFKLSKGLSDSTISFGAFIGVLFVALAAILVFFNQYLVKRMQTKMFPQIESPEQISDQISEQVLVEKDSI